ncbi:hypothetical protein ACVBEQ_08060 [Nakamurella sp. GG22]
MGKAASAALAGRVRTRQRAVEAGAEQAARDLRLTAAAADVHRAQEAIDAARERAALAVAAARAVEHDEVSTAVTVRDAAVRRAAAEGLTVVKVAELVGLPATEVRRILRTSHTGQPPARPAGGP